MTYIRHRIMLSLRPYTLNRLRQIADTCKLPLATMVTELISLALSGNLFHRDGSLVWPQARSK